MKIFAVLTLCLASWAADATDQAATVASVRDLLEANQTRKLVDGTFGQLDTMMQASMKRATGETAVKPGQQAVMDGMRAKLLKLIREEMKWEVLEPEFIEIYRTSFTEEEVVGMLDFYRSPAGQAMVAKMPQVMQQSLAMSQKHMAQMMPKLQQLQKETMEELQACCKDGKE
jgi:hypothetical protein